MRRTRDEDASVDDAQRDDRVHVNTGATCNNNCLFCMEANREGRSINNSAITPEVVRGILESRRGAPEVCFTSGEPTTNPNLAQYASWARELGYERVSVMSNGRLFAYESYVRRLVAAGMNRFIISLHGHEAKIHEGLTRTPDSFAQTVEGVKNVAKCVRHGCELHVSAVVTTRNVAHLGDIYAFARGLGAQQVIFNTLQVSGRADSHFEQVTPSYSTVVREFRAFLEHAGKTEPRVMAFLLDVPPCVTTGIADFNRGHVERHVHFGVASGDWAEWSAAVAAGLDDLDVRLVPLDGRLFGGTGRTKGPECARCVLAPSCEGVWYHYVRRNGWAEFQPVLQEPA